MNRHAPWVYAVSCLCAAAFSQKISAQQTSPGSQQVPSAISAQQAVNGPSTPGALTWDQVKTKFEASNPQLKADSLNVDEMRAEEITAFLRPNPQFTFSEDGAQIAPHNGVWQPLSGIQEQSNIGYLIERRNKRHLRLETAQDATHVAESQHQDLDRTLTFGLRSAFVQTLQAKAVLKLAQEDLAYYDHIIDISRDRLRAGDIAQVDFDRIELQRVQYESELQNALVNLRTAKIQLMQYLDQRTPIEQFDVQGPFDFTQDLQDLEHVRQLALDNRPDLRAALQQIEQSKAAHKLAEANGSTDPTLSGWWTHNGSYNNVNAEDALGLSVNIPLRIFDRNQGEKKRTAIDVDRSTQLTEQARAQVFADVDSAYTTVQSNVDLLKPYKSKYLDESTRVRDTITYSYEHGGASLADFLNAQSDYRSVQLAYLQLIGTYLSAASQLNLAVGREVIP
ncbi:TolC family protein [Acidicapsa dinghuensis]|uniref:TolC family protein n=1 Tax=Acidicapsa dinghuensis TaxID=2218256 RepID=A0ABW1EJY4_9BACT|nr:TolC family protein [Acidicapsa dinghuensis]